MYFLGNLFRPYNVTLNMNFFSMSNIFIYSCLSYNFHITLSEGMLLELKHTVSTETKSFAGTMNTPPSLLVFYNP